jgi:hypothetical protein
VKRPGCFLNRVAYGGAAIGFIAALSGVTMKNLFFCLALWFSVIAHDALAAQYEFSYTFGSGSIVRGTLTGTANGDYVEDLSNVRVFFNDVPFSGNPDLFMHNIEVRLPPILSPVLSINNFAISVSNNATYDVANGEFFYIVKDPYKGQAYACLRGSCDMGTTYSTGGQ